MATRRQLLAGAAALTGGAALPFFLRRPTIAQAREIIAEPVASGVHKVAFDLAERPTALPCFDGHTLPMWTFQADPPFPLVRMKLGERLEASFKNDLPQPREHATIHWHGLRIPNPEDGVPYMTQSPVDPGEVGTYSFVPPDTGTYFFHTHCNSVVHFGRGLVGALIIEGDEAEPSDADIVLLMKDWRLSADRSAFIPFSTDEGAARAGTAGTVRSVNGITKPVIKVQTASNVRIRLLNVDPMRISEIALEGAEAAIIAVDGNGLTPVPLESWRLGPAQRLDILFRAPAEGKTAQLMDYFSKEPVILAEFTSEGPVKRQDGFVATPLKVTPYKKADLQNAERLTFDFSATPTGAAIAALGDVGSIAIGSLCLAKRSFWAINKQAWPSPDHRQLGPPLAQLKSGRTYIFELKNLTPQAHPVHIHGHTFEFVRSSLRKSLPQFRADTVLLLPKERIEVALVAGLPGKWMFHCHILEHQEAGMMGYVQVT